MTKEQLQAAEMLLKRTLPQKGFTPIEWVVLAVVVFGIGGWVWNAVKLSSCDFEPDYRCEMIHGAGLVVPTLSIVTVWFDDDGVKAGGLYQESPRQRE